MGSIDPFIMQLVIVPLIVIGFGVAVSIVTKKLFIAPIITLILNLMYEFSYFKIIYPELPMNFSSWNIIYPIVSFIISWVLLSFFKKKINHEM